MLLFVSIAHSFHCRIVFHFRNIPDFVYPFTSLWTFGLFPLPDYYEQCCCESTLLSVTCKSLCEAVSFISLGWNCWLKVYGKLMFSTSRNSRAVLHDCTIFHFQQQCMHVQAIVSVPKDIVKQGNICIAGFRIKAQLSPLFSVLQHYNHNISQAPPLN